MDFSKLKAGSFAAQDKNCMENGSVYRITGRKREFAAHYMQGDFVRFVSLADMPDNLTIALEKKQALQILPGCFRGN